MQAAPELSSHLVTPRPRWVAPAAVDAGCITLLATELNLPSGICRLLAQRGHVSTASAKAFLRPHPGQLHSPTLMAGMAAAVDRLSAAVRGGEPILVHGDYDVDGICATALLVRSLRMMGGNAIPFVPDRIRDGYDLGAAGIDAARGAGARLIVTADCGIVAHAAVAEARLAGIDVIVTDHHTPAATLPAAVAVVNPNRSDCPYPEKGLAGVGVAFKLATAVATELGFPAERLNALLDFVAVATIADLAPLTAENRALVRWGGSVLMRTPNPGFRALLHSSGLSGREEISAGQIGFILAPRLNAAGRLGDAMRGVRMLLTDDPREAGELARDLEVENQRRRDLDEATLADALGMLETEYNPDRDFGVVLASSEWHPGVIGIVASRVVERIHRPTVLIALGPGEGKGSARSIRGFHLHDAFVACAPHLIRFGGHRAAAGCSIDPSRVSAFREAFNQAARAALGGERPVPELYLDGELTIAEANVELHRLLRHFAPFGIGNPGPVFASFGVRIRGSPRIVGKNHLKITLASGGATLGAIGFGMADRLDEISGPGARVDVAYRLEENEWRGSRVPRTRPEVQARLLDIRKAE